MVDNPFPNNSPNFTERENILHSLIESKICKNYQIDYVLNMVHYLQNYIDKNGKDDIIDVLFVKYLKKCKTIINIDKLSSQYHIALAVKNKDSHIINEIISQSNKIINGQQIKVNGVEISNCFSNLIVQNLISNSLILTSSSNKSNQKYSVNEITNLIQNKQKVDFYAFKNILINKDDMKKIYDEFLANIYQYFSLEFWGLVAAYELITDFTIDAGNDPFLLNAGACLSYKCRRIKVNYDISKIQLPKHVNKDVLYLICYQLNLSHLLEYQTDSHEIKNLCSLVYLLYLNEIPIDSLCNYMNLMEPNSFIILILVYSNYIKDEISDSIINAVIECFNSNKAIFNNILFKYTFSMMKSKTHFYSRIPNDYLYIVPKSIFNDLNSIKFENNAAFYAFAKRALLYGKVLIPDEIITNNNFQSFIDKIIPFVDNRTRKILFYKFKFDLSKEDNIIEVLSFLINEHEYSNAIDLLYKIKLSQNIIKLFKSQSMINKMKILLKHINEYNCTYEILDKFELLSVLNLNEKYELFFKDKLKEISLHISRNNILRDSINAFNQYGMENKKIRIRYNNEFGTDAGGLARDWFTSISKVIKDSGIFIATPNGDKLTFNINKKDDEITFFTGQLIGTALSNMTNVDLKLTSFIWKKILNHQISIDDMKDYDTDLYNSLKWISENDVTDCGLTFVNSNDEEMIKNGKNIDVNNDNKKDYINLIIDDKLIKNFTNEIENISSGFRSVIGKYKVDLLYTSSELYKVINGNEKIDIDDWKMNTVYSTTYKQNYVMFFNVIKDWSMIKQQKLLKFVTGSSQVPIDGFKDYRNRGGLIKLNFIDYEKNRLPSSHTCNNHLDIPAYKTYEEFDNALSIAIECDDFGFI